MKVGIYCIWDRRTSWMTPTFDMNDASATRNFEAALFHEDSLFNTHYQDFALYRLGSFDSDTGLIAAFEEPSFLIDGEAALGYRVKRDLDSGAHRSEELKREKGDHVEYGYRR